MERLEALGYRSPARQRCSACLTRIAYIDRLDSHHDKEHSSVNMMLLERSV